MNQKKHIYFASDFHLGLNIPSVANNREEIIIEWLRHIEPQTRQLYLLGDVFDHWFEYNDVVPKGYIRFLSTLARFVDKGIDVIFFTGNHDLWVRDYFQKELGIEVFHSPRRMTLDGKKIFLAHGDGLGPGDKSYKFLRAILHNQTCIRLFSYLHPSLGLKLMKYYSLKSRIGQQGPPENSFIPEGERGILFSENYLQEHQDTDYFIMGHRHLPIDYVLSNGRSRYVNLGDWIRYFSYAQLANGELTLKFFKSDHPVFTRELV